MQITSINLRELQLEPASEHRAPQLCILEGFLFVVCLSASRLPAPLFGFSLALLKLALTFQTQALTRAHFASPQYEMDNWQLDFNSIVL